MSVPAGPAARPKAPMVLGGLLLVVALASLTGYLLRRGQESTDDAQVEGRIVNVSPRVAGQVRRLLVADNQYVKAGELLVELDPADLEARLLAARADLASARASEEAAKAQLLLTERNAEANLRQARGSFTQARGSYSASNSSVSQAEADLQAARSRLHQARLDLDRGKTLRERGAISVAEMDARQTAYDQAEAQQLQAEARLSSARSGTTSSVGAIDVARGRMAAAETAPQQIDAARAQVQLAAARVQQAEAALRSAELNVSYTKIHAPSGGVVSRRSVEVGALVSPERPLLAIVPLDDVWVVANFKEDQLAEMRPGQRVGLRVDTYGGRPFAGHIDSISGATGARFALLPPDNASGNFVKVAQRVPVLIKLDGADSSQVPLRPGMSANVTVYTR